MKKMRKLLLGFLAIFTLTVNAQTYTDIQFTNKDLAKVYRGTQTGGTGSTQVTRLDTLNARVLRELGKVSLIQSQVSTSINQDTLNARVYRYFYDAVSSRSDFETSTGSSVFKMGSGSVFIDATTGESVAELMYDCKNSLISTNNKTYGTTTVDHSNATLATAIGSANTFLADKHLIQQSVVYDGAVWHVISAYK